MFRCLKGPILAAVPRLPLWALLWGWSMAGWSMAEDPTFHLLFAGDPPQAGDRRAPGEASPAGSELFAALAASPFAHSEKEPPHHPRTDFKFSPGEPAWIRRGKFVTDGIFDGSSDSETMPLAATPASAWANWSGSRDLRRRRTASWLSFPFQFEKFTGWVLADEPIHRQIHNGQGNLFGGRLGWDFAPRWGVETRIGYVRTTLGSASRTLIPSHENFVFWDTSLAFYPRGDARWRPFVELGAGLVNVGFIDDQGVRWNENLPTLPVAAGFKYRINRVDAVRLDITDFVVFGSARGGNGRQVMHDPAVFFAYERRFGLPRKTHFSEPNASRWQRVKAWLSSMSY
ncbi:MAG TPA: hypothetical protein VMV10_15250 [Pirellulales bacterium]|nr:hypothetical protein [Pirellulales bacterium]